MKRFIPLIGDTVLAAVCAFLLFFTLVRYYSGSAAGIAAGICGAMAAGGAAFAYISIKQKKSSDSAAESSGAVKLFTHLSLLESGEAAELFRSLIPGGKTQGDRVESDDAIYFLHFEPEPADMNDVLCAARAKTDKKKYFVCRNALPACAEFAQCADVEILNAAKIYKLFKDARALPQKYLGERSKVKFFARIKGNFSRKVCLPAFWSGAALLFFSYFTYYPIYYIITGSLLLTLCVAAAIFGKSKGA